MKALHEYQFLPEQPSVRSDSYDRVMPSQYYGSPTDVASNRAHIATTGRSFTHGNELVPSSGYGFQGSVTLLPHQQGRSGEIDNVARKMDTPTPPGAHPITGIDNPFATPSITHEEELARIERKRKVGFFVAWLTYYMLLTNFF